MKKILGLDLGVTSIGWALITENDANSENQIIGMGSRIIPLSTDDKNEFTSGNAISKNQKRTKNRTLRKGYDRYQLRRKYLIEELQKADMFPDETLKNLNKLNLWQLRSNAVNQRISLKELGRVLLHLNQKRGYKSSRNDANLAKKDTEYVAAVKNRHSIIKEQCLTIGQYFYNEMLADETYRTKEKIFPREAYIEEFNAIINQQKKHYSEILTENFIQKIKNEIIYYQRKLKSQKELVSVCDFEGFWKKGNNEKEIFIGPKVAHRSSPLFQICKIWENINNISLKDKKGLNVEISIEKKQEIFKYLNNNELLSYAELLKILNLKKDNVYGNKQLSRGIKGNTTKTKVFKCFSSPALYEHLLSFNLEIEENTEEVFSYNRKTGGILCSKNRKIIKPNIESQTFYKLWHTIYSISDFEECKTALIKNFNIDEESADKLSKIDFTIESFGNKSVKAMRKILPYLMDGDVYSVACEYAGYNHSNSLTKDDNLRRKLLDKLQPIEKNSLRQPIVEKILNQMVNLVNSIIEKHGKPDEIRIELARELKQSKEERNDADKYIRRIEKENVDIATYLEEYQLRATRNNIIKWRLYHEINDEDKKLNASCIYCGNPISLSSAIKGEEIDIEHIIPQSRLFDDSQSNKTLSHRKCNADKKNQTAYDFMKSKNQVEFENYIERVNLLYKNGLINKSKRDKLLMPGDKIPDNFIDRQLRETQYIAKKSREILQTICFNVWATSGSVTSELRRIWGWDDVLMNLQLPKYRELNLTEIETFKHKEQIHTREKIVGWSKRNDHRHHAIDALTIACTKQGFIQRLNTLNSNKTKDEMYKAVNEFANANKNNKTEKEKSRNYAISNYEEEKRKLYVDYLFLKRPFSVKKVEDSASKVLISFKAGKKVASLGKRKVKKDGKKIVIQSNGIIVPRGALSEESVYGQIKIPVKNQKIKYLFENPDLIFKPYIKKLVIKRLEEFNFNTEDALTSLKTEPIMLRNGVVLTYATCFSNTYVIKYPVQSIKARDIECIIDGRVREILRDRLEQFGNKEKEAFKDIDKNPIWYNKEKKIAIKSVRCITGLLSVEPLRKNEKKENVAFVKPGNNHHIAIYIDEEGKKHEHICTFWHAIERKKYKFPIVINDPAFIWNLIFQQSDNTFPQEFLKKLPSEKWKIELSMQQNEMFLLGLHDEQIESALNNEDYGTLGSYLYRLQKMSIKGNGQIDLWFRHQYETELIDDANARKVNRFYNFQSLGALFQLNPKKVRIDILGNISKVNY